MKAAFGQLRISRGSSLFFKQRDRPETEASSFQVAIVQRAFDELRIRFLIVAGR